MDNGAIEHDYSAGVTSISNLQLGNLNFEENAGIVSWTDLSVTSSAAAGTKESYTAQIDGTSLLTVYAESDGGGSIKNYGVGIGTTTPTSFLSVQNASTTSTMPLFTVASSTNATLFSVLADGSVGIGTTTSAINNELVVQGGVCITAGTTCPTVSDGSLRVDTAGSVSDDPGDVFDLAERYPASEEMEAGDIAGIDPNSDSKAVVRKGIEGDTAIGIVSTKAAIAINGGDLTLAPKKRGNFNKTFGCPHRTCPGQSKYGRRRY